MPRSDWVNYPIASTSNERVQDREALAASDQYSLPYQSTVICPLWAPPRYQCRKLFPECHNGTDTSSGAEKWWVTHICLDTCLAAETANREACVRGLSDDAQASHAY